MRMKRAIGMGVALCFGILFFSSLALTADAPDKVTIGEISSKFEPAELPHKKHADAYKCTDCHHTYKGEGAVQKCSSCHDPKEAKDKVLDLKNAYHKQCTPCHKKENEAGKKAPVKCLECHPKKQ